MDTALDIANDLRSELHYLTEYVARLESRILDLEGAADPCQNGTCTAACCETGALS
jgi:exonuclease VII small subunit